MNVTFPYAVTAMLFGIMAQLPAETTTLVAFLERYGFPVLVSVALWLRLERNQKDDRADRAASEAERLKALQELKGTVEEGQNAHLALAMKAIETNAAHAAAVASLSERIHTYRSCPVAQLELFKPGEVVSLAPARKPNNHEPNAQ